MLEILRAISQNQNLNLMHNIIFLFNSAEENILQVYNFSIMKLRKKMCYLASCFLFSLQHKYFYMTENASKTVKHNSLLKKRSVAIISHKYTLLLFFKNASLTSSVSSKLDFFTLLRLKCLAFVESSFYHLKFTNSQKLCFSTPPDKPWLHHSTSMGTKHQSFCELRFSWCRRMGACFSDWYFSLHSLSLSIWNPVQMILFLTYA